MQDNLIDEMLNTPDSDDIDQIVSEMLSIPDFDPRKEVQAALPYTQRVYVNDIVPEEYQMQLMQLDFTMSHCYWKIGDIANELINSVNRERAKKFGKVVTNNDIFDAVGYFCHRSGRTVRDYWEISRYFPEEMRKEYDASHAVWREARWVDNPGEFLQIAIDNPQLSVNAVRAEYYRRIGKTPPTRAKPDGEALESNVSDGGVELPLPVDGEHWSGDAQPRFKNTMIARLDATIDQLRSTADRVRLPLEIKKRIADILLELQDIALEIRRVG